MTMISAFQSRIAEYEANRPIPYALPERPSSCYVTMRDGCRIAVDVYLPQSDENSERFPTLLLFTPYFRRFALKHGSDANPSPNTGKFSDYFVPSLLSMCAALGQALGRATGSAHPPNGRILRKSRIGSSSRIGLTALLARLASPTSGPRPISLPQQGIPP
mgnify:CR=1 FL=1